MKVRMKKDTTLPMMKKGSVFFIQCVSEGSGGKLYFVSYYGNSIGVKAEDCEVLDENTGDC